MALYPDVASRTVNQFDGRNLLWRSVIRYGTFKIWSWPLLMTLAVARFQILDDVSNLIQTRMRDRLKLIIIGRCPTIRPWVGMQSRSPGTMVRWPPCTMGTCARSSERQQSLLLCRYYVRSEFCF